MSDHLSLQDIEDEIEHLFKRLPGPIKSMTLDYYGCDNVLLDKVFTLDWDILLVMLEFSGIFCGECGLMKTQYCDAKWFLEKDWIEGSEPKCSAFVCVDCDYDVFQYEMYYTCEQHRLYDEDTGQDLTRFVDVNYYSSDDLY